MGTNYYVRTNECKECNRYDEQHIGKSSMGWKFLFNPFKETFRKWSNYLKKHKDSIYNEYGEKVTLKDLIDLVKEKQKTGISLKDRPDQIGPFGSNDPDNYETLDKNGYVISKYDKFS